MRYFLNGRVWWNDSDSTYVRASLPIGRARLGASWAAISDSLFEVGDWLPDMPEERVEILRRTVPPDDCLVLACCEEPAVAETTIVLTSLQNWGSW